MMASDSRSIVAMFYLLDTKDSVHTFHLVLLIAPFMFVLHMYYIKSRVDVI